MKNARLLSLTLALILAAGTVSCGSSPDVSNDGTTAAQDSGSVDTTVDLLAPPDLPDKDYGGYEFNILLRVEGWGIYNNEHFYIEEENGEVLNDAIYNRNRIVEEAFNVKITETVTKSDIGTEISRVVMAGDDAYDLAIPSNFITSLGPEYLVDLYTLDYLNLDRPWWNQNSIAAYSINGKLCSAISSMMITHMDSVLAMFYNQKLAADNKLPDLYQLVRDGKWTLAKFAEITKNVTVDVDGNGEYNDKDRYAFVGLDGIGRLGSGVQLDTVVKDKSGIPQLNLKDELLVNRISQLRDYAVSLERDIYDPRTDKNTGGDGDKAVFRLFLNDQTIFFVHGLGCAQQFRDMKSDFGVIPTPKLDDKQENYSIAPDVTKCIAIPTVASDLERTAIILEAMSYHGYDYLRPRYYETMLQSKYLRDEESVEMLDEYIYTNIGIGTPTGSKSLDTALKNAKNGNGEIASTFAASEAAIQEELNKFVALYQ